MTHKIVRLLLICLLLAMLALPVASLVVNSHVAANSQPYFSLSQAGGKISGPVMIACDPQSSNQGCSGG